jgi:hypothetical protein
MYIRATHVSLRFSRLRDPHASGIFRVSFVIQSHQGF